jgi:TonB family protein
LRDIESTFQDGATMATQVSDTGSKTRRGSLSDELAAIAQRAQAFTNASGTAIALGEGNMDEIICRARSGSSAPEVGTALRVEGSFTGLCIQSGKELRCDDAETDTRVDTAAIRALGIRSMVVTPIKEDNRVVGVLAVFAPTAHAFTITHVAVLKTMGDQISVLLQKDRRAREEGVQPEPVRPEPPRPAVPVAAPKPVAAAPPPVVIKPAAPAPAPAPRAAYPVVSKVEPLKTTVMAEDIAPAVTPPSREDRRSAQKMEPRASLSSFDAVAGDEKKSGVSLLAVGVGAVAVLAAASTFVVLKIRKTGPANPPAVQHAQVTPNPQTTQPAAPTSAGAANTQPASVASPSSAPAPKALVDNSSENSKRPEKSPVKSSVPEKTTPAEKRAPEAETVALSTAPSKIATSTPDASQDAAPALALGATPGSGSLSALAKTGGAKPSMLAQSELVPVQVLKKVSPVYPTIAKQRRLTGILVVDALVDKSGKVTILNVVSGPPVFRDAAFDAIKQWQFKPALLNSQPIDQHTQIRLEFKPS